MLTLLLNRLHVFAIFMFNFGQRREQLHNAGPLLKLYVFFNCASTNKRCCCCCLMPARRLASDSL